MTNAFTRPSWSTRIIRAQRRFNIVKRDKGTGAALRLFGRFATVRLTPPALRFLEYLAAVLPLPKLFMRHGVLFVGYLEAALGLGESLRGLVRSVAATQLPFALYPYSPGVETRLTGSFMKDRYDLRRPYKINVIEMAADQVPALFHALGQWKTGHSYNILRTYWELPEAPPEWAAMLKDIQEMWVPNDFVFRAFQGVFHGPIMVVPPCVAIETKNDFSRQRFGMDQDRFYFMFSFDYFSRPSRKNPLGVVRAFRQAFPDLDDRVGLVMKSTSAIDHYPEVKSAIIEAARLEPRIRIIDDVLSRDEMLSLVRQSDCYVSLHRSEGFGLGMAEALAFGKPVIGTNYSGNTDFLSDRTGFPVSATLRPVQPGEYVYSTGQSWAEPDEAAAVEAMRCVFQDPLERQRRAAAGKALVETRYGRENVGRIATQRLRDILATR